MWRTVVFAILALLLLAQLGDSYVPAGARSGARQSSPTQLFAGQVPMVPYYPNPSSKDYQWMDIYNALGRTRTLFVGRFLDEEACNQLIASLIWLQGQNEKDPITLYFNVPGSIAKPSMAVYDVMRRMTCPIKTVNAGLTVGMGCLLCAVGTKGMRYALPNSRFLMSRVGLEDGTQGQASDIALAVADVLKDNAKATAEMSRLCGVPLAKLQIDMKRDFYLTAAEAAAYGLVDHVMRPEQPVKMMRYRGVDDDVVNFGHFSEVRLLKSGPEEVVVQHRDKEAFDDYAAQEMAKQGIDGNGAGKRLTQQDIKKQGAAGRFANSRLKPPGINKPIKPKSPDGPSDPDDNQNKFANTGW